MKLLLSLTTAVSVLVATVPSIAPAAASPQPTGAGTPAAQVLVVDGDPDRVELENLPGIVDTVYDADLDRTLVTVDGARDAGGARRQVAGLDGVERVELDLTVTADGDQLTPPRVPSDPHWSAHWGAKRYGVEQVFTTTLGGPVSTSPKVAILDTGVAPNAELGARLLPGVDLVNGGGDGRRDVNGHGTMSALTAAAAANNGLGAAGVCPRCRIIPVTVLGDDGRGTATGIANGIHAALDLGADVINLSLSGKLGTSPVPSFMADAIAAATAAGVPVVASAGNESIDSRTFPAADPGAIGVAAVARDGEKAPWSNFGSWVDVAAPSCSPVINRDEAPVWYCGTSASAPFVAGAIALRRAAVGPEPIADLRAHLEEHTYGKSWVRTGAIDVCALVHGAGDVPQLDGPATWPVGGAPGAALVSVPHVCGVDRLTVSVGGTTSTRQDLDRAVGAVSVEVPLDDLSTGSHQVRLASTDRLGRTTSSTATLTVTDAPAPAPAASAAARVSGPARATVSWTGASTGVTSWRVSGGGAEVTVPASARTATLAGLPVGTATVFSVAAEGIGGSSAPTTTAPIVPIDVPVKAPRPRLKQTDVDSVRVTWSAAATSDAAPVTGYQVLEGGRVVATVNASTRNVTLSSRSVGTLYRYTVRARNAAGNGPVSDPRSLRVVNAPPRPAGMKVTASADGRLRATWSAPVSTRATPVTAVEVRLDGKLVATLPPTATARHINGLVAGRDYRVQVRNVNHYTAASRARTARAINRPAAVPRITSATTAGAGKVALRWDASRSTVAAPRVGYRISCVRGCSSRRVLVTTTDRRATVSGLPRNTSVRLRVVAYNSAGNSDVREVAIRTS